MTMIQSVLGRWVAAGLILVAWSVGIGPQTVHAAAKGSKSNAKSGADGALKKTSDKLAVLERIHKSFAAKKVGDHVVFTPEDLDKNLKQRIGAEEAEYAPVINDEVFIRRVSLDLTGRVPDGAAVKEFVASTDGRKRARLIDRLLDSPEYARHWAHYWRTVLTYNAPAKAKTVNYGALEDWLAEEFQRNSHWDQIVCELISATPKTPKKGADNGPQDHGPNNFVLAYENKPGEIASQTARLFMGISIQCAECHDHPFDRWKREQFHEMAAFFSPKKTYEMPDKDDPSKKTEIEARFLLGERPSPDLSPDALRVAVAAYLVYNPDNYWFARAYVNRIWNELLGDGFYSVDSLGPDKECNYQPVINRLGAVFRYRDFDVKWVFRTIMNSQAYQREIRTMTDRTDKLFTAVRPSRMRPDQVVAALENVTGSLGKTKRTVSNTFGVDLSVPQESLEGSIQQALLLMNNQQLNQSLSKSNLRKDLSHIKANDKLLSELYLGILAREPTANELERGKAYLTKAASRDEAIDDLMWVLVNSTEFVTKR
jgi:hypothetical protein